MLKVATRMKILTKPLPTGHDYCCHIKKHPATKRFRYSGDHLTADGPDGRITVADDRRELAPWLRKKIWLELVAIGLGIMLIAIVATGITA